MLREDFPKTILAIGDIINEPHNTKFYYTLSNGKISSYLLLYGGASPEVASIEANTIHLAERLSRLIPYDRFLLNTSIELLPQLTSGYDVQESYEEFLMVADRDTFTPFDSELSLGEGELKSSILGPSNIDDVLHLVPEEDRLKTREGYLDWLRISTLYGLFLRDRLVAMTGLVTKTPYGWVLGNTCTAPDYRGSGLATLVVSKLTAETLRQTEKAFAFAHKTHAVSLLKRLGYEITRVRAGALVRKS